VKISSGLQIVDVMFSTQRLEEEIYVRRTIRQLSLKFEIDWIKYRASFSKAVSHNGLPSGMTRERGFAQALIAFRLS